MNFTLCKNGTGYDLYEIGSQTYIMQAGRMQLQCHGTARHAKKGLFMKPRRRRGREFWVGVFWLCWDYLALDSTLRRDTCFSLSYYYMDVMTYDFSFLFNMALT